MASRRSPPADWSSEASAKGEAPDTEEGIAAALQRLADEVQLLRIALDELRENFQWAVRNPTETGPRVRITSLAADPAAPDFGERINAVPPEELDRLRAEAAETSPVPSVPPSPRSHQEAADTQRRLW